MKMKRIVSLFLIILMFGCLASQQPAPSPTPSPLPTATISPGELEGNISNLCAEIAEIENIDDELDEIYALNISESDLNALINST